MPGPRRIGDPSSRMPPNSSLPDRPLTALRATAAEALFASGPDAFLFSSDDGSPAGWPAPVAETAGSEQDDLVDLLACGVSSRRGDDVDQALADLFGE